jgi:outer membrane protein assembly factor BamB
MKQIPLFCCFLLNSITIGAIDWPMDRQNPERQSRQISDEITLPLVNAFTASILDIDSEKINNLASPVVKRIDTTDYIYIGTPGGIMRAFDHSGSLKWSFKSGGSILAAAAVGLKGQDNVVVFGTAAGKIYLLNAVTGQKIWEKFLGNPVFASVLIDEQYVYAADNSGKIYKIALEDASVIWTATSGGYQWAGLTLGQGNIYAVSILGRIQSLNLETGSVNWQINISESFRFSAGYLDGKLYVPGHRGSLHCLDALNGNQNWIINTGTGALSPVALYQDNGTQIVVASRSGEIYRYHDNGQTPILKWQTSTGGEYYSGPSLSVSKALVVNKSADQQSFLKILNLETGIPEYEYPLPGQSGSNSNIAVAGSRVYFTSNNQHIIGLYPASQTVPEPTFSHTFSPTFSVSPTPTPSPTFTATPTPRIAQCYFELPLTSFGGSNWQGFPGQMPSDTTGMHNAYNADLVRIGFEQGGWWNVAKPKGNYNSIIRVTFNVLWKASQAQNGKLKFDASHDGSTDGYMDYMWTLAQDDTWQTDTFVLFPPAKGWDMESLSKIKIALSAPDYIVSIDRAWLKVEIEDYCNEYSPQDYVVLSPRAFGGSGWHNTSETRPADTTGIMFANNNNYTRFTPDSSAWWEVEDLPPGVYSTSIRQVRALIRWKRYNTNPYFRLRFQASTDNTLNSSTDESMCALASQNWQTDTVIINPPSGGWSVQAVNNLKFNLWNQDDWLDVDNVSIVVNLDQPAPAKPALSQIDIGVGAFGGTGWQQTSNQPPNKTQGLEQLDQQSAELGSDQSGWWYAGAVPLIEGNIKEVRAYITWKQGNTNLSYVEFDFSVDQTLNGSLKERMSSITADQWLTEEIVLPAPQGGWAQSHLEQLKFNLYKGHPSWFDYVKFTVFYETVSATPTMLVSFTATATLTQTPSDTPTATTTASYTPTLTSSVTPSATETGTETPSATVTQTAKGSFTQTPRITLSDTNTVTDTTTPTPTPSATLTLVITVSYTNTPLPTASPTPSITQSATSTQTITPPIIYTDTPTHTPTPLQQLSPQICVIDLPAAQFAGRTWDGWNPDDITDTTGLSQADNGNTTIINAWNRGAWNTTNLNLEAEAINQVEFVITWRSIEAGKNLRVSVSSNENMSGGQVAVFTSSVNYKTDTVIIPPPAEGWTTEKIQALKFDLYNQSSAQRHEIDYAGFKVTLSALNCQTLTPVCVLQTSESIYAGNTQSWRNWGTGPCRDTSGLQDAENNNHARLAAWETGIWKITLPSGNWTTANSVKAKILWQTTEMTEPHKIKLRFEVSWSGQKQGIWGWENLYTTNGGTWIEESIELESPDGFWTRQQLEQLEFVLKRQDGLNSEVKVNKIWFEIETDQECQPIPPLCTITLNAVADGKGLESPQGPGFNLPAWYWGWVGVQNLPEGVNGISAVRLKVTWRALETLTSDNWGISLDWTGTSQSQIPGFEKMTALGGQTVTEVFTIKPPTGGWTVEKINQLEVLLNNNGQANEVIEHIYFEIDINQNCGSWQSAALKKDANPFKNQGPESLIAVPNPARNKVVLQWNAFETGESLIGIYDLSGRLVLPEMRVSNLRCGEISKEIDIQSLASGIYIAMVISPGIDGVKKVKLAVVK